jgi:hypothetical protein
MSNFAQLWQDHFVAYGLGFVASVSKSEQSASPHADKLRTQPHQSNRLT